MSLYSNTVDRDVLSLEALNEISHSGRFGTSSLDVEVIDLFEKLLEFRKHFPSITHVKFGVRVSIMGGFQGSRDVSGPCGLEEHRLSECAIVIEWF